MKKDENNEEDEMDEMDEKANGKWQKVKGKR